MPASQPSHGGLKQSGARRGAALSHSGGRLEKTKQKTQTIKPANQRERRRQAEHALVRCHEHTHAKSHETQVNSKKTRRYHNNLDDIHLMMTFLQNTDMENYTQRLKTVDDCLSSPQDTGDALSPICDRTGNVSSPAPHKSDIASLLSDRLTRLGGLSIDPVHFLASFSVCGKNRFNNDCGSDCVSVCVFHPPPSSPRLFKSRG